MRLSLGFLLPVILLAGCSARPSDNPNNAVSAKTELVVSAATSLKDAFTEIGDLYRAKTGNDVTFNFGASGTLQKQIEAGAPADVFASAGGKQMDELVAKGLIADGTRRDLVGNVLVLIVPADSKLDLKSTDDLKRPEVKKIAVGNPKTVPAGQYTEQFFTRADLTQSIQSKLVLAEDVRQGLDYVSRGEVDAGIVYATDARIAGDKVRVVGPVPADMYDPIRYPIAVIKDAKNHAAADEFVVFVMSDEGQRILQKYGFTPASQR